MMVANSFDLWKKDAFFSAAEEVQESADRMDSVYRAWSRERREGLTAEALDELSRELQTALGTAKWQLEEFERAVRLNYQNHLNDSTTTRHSEFVAALGNQISHVEAALRKSFNVEGKQPLRWVNLDEEECNDLALFLSGNSGTPETAEDVCMDVGPSKGSLIRENQNVRRDPDLSLSIACNRDIPYERAGSMDMFTIKREAKQVIELESEKIIGTGNDISSQADKASGSRRMWSSSNSDDWKIIVANADEQSNRYFLSTEATSKGKEKDSRPVFWKQKRGELPKSKGGGMPTYFHLGGVSGSNQLFGRFGLFQRQPHSPRHLQFSCSVRVMLALMLTIFLTVPFVLYSN